jgi:DNA-binding transcriptional regulator GbsR (MarR family)
VRSQQIRRSASLWYVLHIRGFLNFQDVLKIEESMKLPPLVQTFVLHFGEMGSRWGINRTVGQIYALLFVSPAPLNADQIAEKLDFSRSNVSMGLKELEAWRLVRLQHIPGDRREYFSTPEDVWVILRTLAEERRRREVDPTLTMLRDVLMETPSSDEERHAQARMREMHEMIEMLTGWFRDVQGLENKSLIRLLNLGSKVQKVLQLGQDITTGTRRRKPARKRDAD